MGKGVALINYRFIKTENKDGIIAVTLNNPPLNVLTIEMMEEMTEAMAWAGLQPGRIIVLNAEGKAFSAGVDIADHTPDKVGKMIEVFDRLFHTMNNIDRPIIAVVDGAALGGGCEVVLFCDLVVASDKAKFGQPEISAGVFPPVACYLLPRIVSWPRAMELILGGEVIAAEKAERMGLINRVFSSGEFAGGVQKFLQKFLKMSPAVLALSKKAVRAGLNKDFSGGIAAIDRIYLDELMRTEDAVEGLSAFLEKRLPVWQGK